LDTADKVEEAFDAFNVQEVFAGDDAKLTEAFAIKAGKLAQLKAAEAGK
jgi:hypothetical protein